MPLDPPQAEPDPATGSEAALTQLTAVEDRLVDRAIALAKSNGYAPYTTTIRAAWSEAIRSLTDCLGQYLREHPAVASGPLADVAYRTDPRFARMRQIARRHRSLGITLELYTGLFKHFRKVYIEELGKQQGPGVLTRVQDFFDESELSVTADWTASGDDRRFTELQARTRALTLQKDRYVAVFESLRHPAFLLDHAQGLVHANHAAIQLFTAGGEVGDSLYLSNRDAMTGELAARVRDLLDQEDDGERWLDTTEGRSCFDVRLRPLQDAVDNTSIGYLLQLYDVTAHRLATEQAQRAERQMSRFLATMSHEIRTPLHSVLGAAGLLRAADQDNRHDYLDVIQSAGQSLLLTLNNVLDYSKLEAGAPVAHPIDTEIRPALDTFRATTVIGSSAARPKLGITVAEAVPDRLLIDWTMTRQVLTNLVSNALRHDNGDGVEIAVALDPADRCTLAFHVRDHGPGFGNEDTQRFLQPFTDTDPRYTGQGGAGLGLAISRYLVSAMGGDIGIENTPDGAQVWFTVAYDIAGTKPEAARIPAAAPSPGLTKCLLVDDDEIGAAITSEQLRALGLGVDHAGSLAAARKALENGSYDAIIADYLLPDGTGPELLSAQPPSARSLRKIALTANLEALKATHNLSEIFDAVLEKPADQASLAYALLGGDAAQDRSEPVKTAEPTPERAGLAGLSPQTVAAMARAFAVQWAAFREDLADHRRGRPVGDLAETAHRLAGSSAQLGLVELVPHLRSLENQDSLGKDADALTAVVDCDLQDLSSWRALTEQEPTA